MVRFAVSHFDPSLGGTGSYIYLTNVAAKHQTQIHQKLTKWHLVVPFEVLVLPTMCQQMKNIWVLQSMFVLQKAKSMNRYPTLNQMLLSWLLLILSRLFSNLQEQNWYFLFSCALSVSPFSVSSCACSFPLWDMMDVSEKNPRKVRIVKKNTAAFLKHRFVIFLTPPAFESLWADASSSWQPANVQLFLDMFPSFSWLTQQLQDCWRLLN